jgi:hypothetical protein
MTGFRQFPRNVEHPTTQGRRMRRFASFLLVTLVTLTVASACRAQDQTPEQAGAALVFANDNGGLSQAEQLAIYQSLGIKLDSTGKGFLDTSCDQPAGVVVSFPDLNGDGTKEVLVFFGNSCTSGMTGSSVLLFIKNSAGAYSSNFGFPGASADPQPTSNLGYPDLLIGGPGFCFPIWRWDGTSYQYLKNEPQGPGGCDNR